MLQLQAAIKYEQDDLAGTKAFVDKCLPDDPDTIVAEGCIAFKVRPSIAVAPLRCALLTAWRRCSKGSPRRRGRSSKRP
jgi:hypothetical protein